MPKLRGYALREMTHVYTESSIAIRWERIRGHGRGVVIVCQGPLGALIVTFRYDGSSEVG